jgi:hypothetical protein
MGRRKKLNYNVRFFLCFSDRALFNGLALFYMAADPGNPEFAGVAIGAEGKDEETIITQKQSGSLHTLTSPCLSSDPLCFEYINKPYSSQHCRIA